MRTATLLGMTVLVLVTMGGVACDREPALLRQAREAEVVVSLSRAFQKSVEAEKSAVLATTDDESERFASESRQAAAEVERLQKELQVLIGGDGRQAERDRLQAFGAAWAKVAAIDARLLPLAVANTNLKAAHRSTHEAAAALERLETALAALEGESKDPARLRELSRAAVAALTIQTLHAPHIASPSDPEMTALEARIQGLQLTVDRVLAVDSGGARRDEALQAWRDYQAHTAEVLRLSRENTNVLSFSISVHEKRDASTAADAALQALVTEVQSAGPRPTR
jgi:hypothetical protein